MPQSFLTRLVVLLTLCLVIVVSPAQAQITASDRGGSLYMQKCITCHGMDKNKIGPLLRGVYGRKAGEVKDFAYSDALKKSGITWDNIALNKFLANPTNVIKGTTMVGNIELEKDRDDLIAFLKNIPKESGPPSGPPKIKTHATKPSSN